MNNPDFTIRFSVSRAPQQVFDAINDVRAWWSEDFIGASKAEGDEFEVRFADVHYSRQRLTEIVPGERITWLVTDSRLSFLENQSEWTGTIIHFAISENNGQTGIIFTHEGLVPSIQCYKDCSNGWNYYLRDSLIPFIATGAGNPNRREKERGKKSLRQ